MIAIIPFIVALLVFLASRRPLGFGLSASHRFSSRKLRWFMKHSRCHSPKNKRRRLKRPSQRLSEHPTDHEPNAHDHDLGRTEGWNGRLAVRDKAGGVFGLPFSIVIPALVGLIVGAVLVINWAMPKQTKDDRN